MKHFGISSLMAGTLLFTLLDLAPLPDSSGCKDKHKPLKEKYDQLEIVGFTIYAVDVGADWVELEYEANAQIGPAFQDAFEIGVEYWVKEKTKYTKPLSITVGAVRLLKPDEKVIEEETPRQTVRIDGLKRGQTYSYRPYIIKSLSNKILYGVTKTFTTLKK